MGKVRANVDVSSWCCTGTDNIALYWLERCSWCCFIAWLVLASYPDGIMIVRRWRVWQYADERAGWQYAGLTDGGFWKFCAGTSTCIRRVWRCAGEIRHIGDVFSLCWHCVGQ